MVTMKCTLLVLIGFVSTASVWSRDMIFYPCVGSRRIITYFKPNQPIGRDNRYSVHMVLLVPSQPTPPQTVIQIDFDSEAKVLVTNDIEQCVTESRGYETSTVINCDTSDTNALVFHIKFSVKGPSVGTVPYFKSIKVNGHEECNEARLGYLDNYLVDYQTDRCGLRKVDYTELIYYGLPTKPGDWPWHAAIYQLWRASNMYTCGGTLISKIFVLTAAHCVTRNKVPLIPDVLSVVLGKYNLIGGDISSQEREVFSVKVHKNFGSPNRMDNDIALLKLKSEAIFNDYVQPACIWNSEASEKLSSGTVVGYVVGWGRNQEHTLSPQLLQASMPERTFTECVSQDPLFYGYQLTNSSKFCAGWGNGTSPCNGDSGGGYLVFVPDTVGDNSTDLKGAWHIKGIVSIAISRKGEAICDPNYYVLFTDVYKYLSWILEHTRAVF